MGDNWQSGDGSVAVLPRSPNPALPAITVLVALLTVLASAAVCVAAVLSPAPAAALPLVVAISVGCPMFACWELPAAVASLRVQRAHRAAGKALAKLRHGLEQLPEVEHPLGF